MSTSAYYSFIPKLLTEGTHSIDAQRQVAMSPSSFATSSSNSNSSLNQYSSLTPTSSSSTCSVTNYNQSHATNNVDSQSRLPTLVQTDKTHHKSQMLHSYTLHSIEPRPLKPFNNNSDYLEAMKEDLAEWLNRLYPDLDLTADNFFNHLETGATICRHANNVTRMGRKLLEESSTHQLNNDSFTSNGSERSDINSPRFQPSRSLSLNSSFSSPKLAERVINWLRIQTIPFKKDVNAGTFFARDNICQFILWCRSLNILDCLLFETDDLVERKNEKSFILCLLEVARIGFMVGMPTPLIIQLEQEIDREIENDAKLQKQLEDEKRYQEDKIDSISPYYTERTNSENNNNSLEESKIEEVNTEEEEEDLGPKPQVITNDLLSLHERVVQLLCLCTCPTQFPMVRVGDNGKYKVGDKLIIFVRILRRHIMVRVGGGWQELSEFLRQKDPCRSRSCQPQLHQQTKLTPNTAMSKSSLLHSNNHLHKIHHYRNHGGQRLISSSASMSWLSHNS